MTYSEIYSSQPVNIHEFLTQQFETTHNLSRFTLRRSGSSWMVGMKGNVYIYTLSTYYIRLEKVLNSLILYIISGFSIFRKLGMEVDSIGSNCCSRGEIENQSASQLKGWSRFGFS